jgi:hypothetical protein
LDDHCGTAVGVLVADDELPRRGLRDGPAGIASRAGLSPGISSRALRNPYAADNDSILKSCGIRRQASPHSRHCILEDAVFEKTLGARVGARASVRGKGGRSREVTDCPGGLLPIIGLGVVVMLFAWLMQYTSLHQEVWGFGPQSDCASLGKGGVDCNRRRTSDRQSNADTSADDDCTSVGRGARVCTERLLDRGHAN